MSDADASVRAKRDSHAMNARSSKHDSTDFLLVKNLTVSYDDHPVLHEVSLSLRRGELFTLLGPSGSGKSTLLLAVAGIIPTQLGQIVSGNIFLSHDDLTRVPPYKRNMGLVFQSYALFEKSVAENICFPLRIRGISTEEQRRRLHSIIGLLGLEGLEGRYPWELSGGQQQRVALARALVFDPEVLLLDEPLGSIDRKLRQQLQAEIKRVQRALGTTVLYVTHDQTEALSISDRLAIILDGRIRQVGSPERIYRHPRDVETASFLGESNLYPVEVLDVDGRYVNVSLPSGLRLWASGVSQGGRRSYIMIRPEDVLIHPRTSITGRVTTVSGEVEDRVFMGDLEQLIIRISSGDVMKVKCLSRRSRAIEKNVTLFLAASRVRLVQQQAVPDGSIEEGE